MIDKGRVSALKNGGAYAEVIPYQATSTVTIPLVVSEHIMEFINVGDEVVYALFEDNTGIILARLDGRWSHKVEGHVEVTGNVKTNDVQTASVSSLNGHTHGYTHGGESSGSDTTTAPN